MTIRTNTGYQAAPPIVGACEPMTTPPPQTYSQVPTHLVRAASGIDFAYRRLATAAIYRWFSPTISLRIWTTGIPLLLTAGG